MNKLKSLFRRLCHREEAIELNGRALVATEEDPLFLKVVLNDQALRLIDRLKGNARLQEQALQVLREIVEVKLGVGK